jgi:hypothetical protein
MKFPDNYPTAIAGFFLVLAIIALCFWFAGDKYQADLSNDRPDYQEGGGGGHPLWP